MASIIRVKRSTGTTAPSSLNFGEVGVTLSGSGTQGNSGDRLFVGDNQAIHKLLVVDILQIYYHNCRFGCKWC